MKFNKPMGKKEVLAIIPARGGSKRIPNKNIKNFLGQPLIAYAIKQALSNKIVDRVIVDTDSDKIAKIALRSGAEVPWLRPSELATDTAKGIDSILYLLQRLKEEENYIPTHVIILQTTSPLREQKDIYDCWSLMEKTDATTVLTVCLSHPRLYHLSPERDLIWVNESDIKSTNIQECPPGYILNGCFVYLVKTENLIKEKDDITKKTKAVICPKWRSVDLDTPEDWAMAEVVYKNRKKIASRIKNFK